MKHQANILLVLVMTPNQLYGTVLILQSVEMLQLEVLLQVL